MATVRITHEIRNFVRDAFRELKKKRVAEKRQELQALGLAELCYEHTVPAKYRQLARELNADPRGKWLEETDRLAVCIRYQHPQSAEITTSSVTVEFKSPVCMPAFSLRHVRAFEIQQSMPVYETVKNIFLEIEALEAEDRALEANVIKGVLTDCRTLAQVLNVWPSALDFMPEHVRRTHASPTVRRAAKKPALALDDTTKISLMKARMLSTGS